ncbi:MAG: hypothetical protein Q9184_007860 [Pyrenodesmia sp. 2 TL-2023]
MSESYERERYLSPPSPCIPPLLTLPHSTRTPQLTIRRQNNSRLDELSSKVSALRGVTVDIYDNARNQDVLNNTVCPPPSPIPRPLSIAPPTSPPRPLPHPLLSPHPTTTMENNGPTSKLTHFSAETQNEVFSSMTTSIKGSAGRLGRMAQSGNKVAILKLAGMITGAVVLLWWVLGWAFRRKGGGVEGT